MRGAPTANPGGVERTVEMSKGIPTTTGTLRKLVVSEFIPKAL